MYVFVLTLLPFVSSYIIKKGIVCPPALPEPKPSSICNEYLAIHDKRYCIIGYRCAPGQGKTTKAPCEYMNPFEDADVHPESDSNCRFGQPGWTGDERCRCSYIPKEIDVDDCVVRYWAKCIRPGVPTCPPPKFGDLRVGCQYILVDNPDTGCRDVVEDCSVPPVVEFSKDSEPVPPPPQPMHGKKPKNSVPVGRPGQQPSGYHR